MGSLRGEEQHHRARSGGQIVKCKTTATRSEVDEMAKTDLRGLKTSIETF